MSCSPDDIKARRARDGPNEAERTQAHEVLDEEHRERHAEHHRRPREDEIRDEPTDHESERHQVREDEERGKRHLSVKIDHGPTAPKSLRRCQSPMGTVPTYSNVLNS